MKRSDQEPRCYLTTIGSQKRPPERRIKRVLDYMARTAHHTDDATLTLFCLSNIALASVKAPFWAFVAAPLVSWLAVFLYRFIRLTITNAHIDNDRP